MNRKRFAGILFVLLAVGVIMQIPDIKRYLEMRAM
jgi:hypothetical protein